MTVLLFVAIEVDRQSQGLAANVQRASSRGVAVEHGHSIVRGIRHVHLVGVRIGRQRDRSITDRHLCDRESYAIKHRHHAVHSVHDINPICDLIHGDGAVE